MVFKLLDICGVLIVASLFLAIVAEPASAKSVIVNDCLGRSVQINLPIRRIVALNSDCLEVLRILKAEDRVVGVYSDIVRERSFWGDLAKKAKIGKWNEVDIETIVALKPDLVIAYGYAPAPFLEEKLKTFGIKVLRLDFYKIQTLEREVALLGGLLACEAEATRFCEWNKRYVWMIRNVTDKISRQPKVYIENYSDYKTLNMSTGGHEMCTLAGGKNIAAGLSVPYPHVSGEWVLSENPEVIIKMVSNENSYELKSAEPFNKRRDDIMRRPAWKHISGVASGNVYILDGAVSTGPRAIIGVAYMACWLHPELFRNLDPGAMHKEYMEKFQRIAYQGEFVSSVSRKGVK